MVKKYLYGKYSYSYSRGYFNTPTIIIRSLRLSAAPILLRYAVAKPHLRLRPLTLVISLDSIQ